MSHASIDMEGAGSSPETIDLGQGTSPNAPGSSDPTAAQRRAGKRDRVALACQRCKTRKQKCDGQRPACASCARLSLKCVYIVPLVPAAGEKKLYIKALEQRVAELESVLASLGHMGVGTDHLRSLVGVSQFQPQGLIPGALPGTSAQSRQDSDDDANDILAAVRDLSLSASGHYVGASSNITIGRVLSSVVHSARNPVPANMDDLNTHEENDPAPKSVYSSRLTEAIGEPFLSPNVAHRLLEGWFRHIATRYPVLHTANVMELHNNRDNLTNDYDKSILHLVYAVSGRWLESAGEMGHFFSDQHYDIAFQNMDTILQLRDPRAIDYLLLMALYCIRAPRDPGAWTYVGAAMRLCIELGLHRRRRRQNQSVENEMNKRRFWTTYFMDRDISIAIGRPPSLSDHDIDQDLPLDIDEDTRTDDIVQQAAMHVSNLPSSPATSLTSFIHRLRLKKIESEIQHAVYRVDQPGKVPDAVIDGFLERLRAWNEAIPFEARNFIHQPNTAYEGTELYTIFYHRCVRFLLYPTLAEQPINMQYLRHCADACCGLISDYRRLHHVFPVGFSALSIQSMFLAGLTLIYCAWLAPVNFLSVDGPLTDCQLLLYIVTERYPSARKYRDVFERIRKDVLGLISQGKHKPRDPIPLEPSVQEDFNKFGQQSQWGQGAVPGMGSDFTFMINTMTGVNIPTTPPFDLGMDPTAAAAASLMGNAGGPQPHGMGVGQYSMWHGLPHGVPGDMNEIDAMRGIFQ